MYCGTKIINDRYVSGSVSIDKSVDLNNYLSLAKDSLQMHDWSTAGRFVENALLINSKCKDAWYMKALLSFRNENEYQQYLKKAESPEYKEYGIFCKDDIAKCWGEFTITVSVRNLMGRVKLGSVEVTLDGKDTISIGNGSGIFGVSAGSHTFTIKPQLRIIGNILYPSFLSNCSSLFGVA